MRQALDEGQIVIVAGFQGIDENYNITTLGRGGSDTTAVALAAVMKHDPRRRQRRRRLRDLHRRGRHLHHRPAHRARSAQDGRHQLRRDARTGQRRRRRACTRAASSSPRSSTCRCRCASSFSDAEGTWIVPEADWMRDVVVCGAALVKRRGPRRPRRRARSSPASAIASSPPSPPSNIVVDMIAQNVGSGGKAAIGFTVPARRAAGDAGRAAARWPPSWAPRVEHDEEVSKVSIVGTGMRTHTGVAEQMFAALAAAEHQHEDDHHRRHQDFGPGGQGRRRQARCGRSTRRSACTSRGRAPGCRPAPARRRSSAGRAGGRRGRRPRPGRPDAAAVAAWKTSSSATCC